MFFLSQWGPFVARFDGTANSAAFPASPFGVIALRPMCHLRDLLASMSVNDNKQLITQACHGMYDSGERNMPCVALHRGALGKCKATSVSAKATMYCLLTCNTNLGSMCRYIRTASNTYFLQHCTEELLWGRGGCSLNPPEIVKAFRTSLR